MSIKRDLLKEKLLNSKSFNTVYINVEDEERTRHEQMEILVELLCDTKHQGARAEVFNFLKKERKAVDLLIRAISEAKQDKRQLVAVCWEADIDCDRYLEFFTDIILKDELPVALEAFTTIENMKTISPGVAEMIFEKVVEAIPKQTDPTKVALTNDLLEVLRNWQ
jgi:hypothetical protein